MLSNLTNSRTLSPRELARAMGVSESSVKRWIDAGQIPARLTSGGHRRIELMPALRFLRDSGREVVDPGVLGLATAKEPDIADPEVLGERAFELLRTGKSDELTRTLLTTLVTRALEPAVLFDGPIRSAMTRIGELWKGDHRGIYIEHRATQVLLRAIDQASGLFEPAADAPVAVGGSVDGDPSGLPTRIAATVLASEGLAAVDLGANTPLSALLEASDETGAQLVWVSVSYVHDEEAQSAALAQLVQQLAQRSISCILGGREIHRLRIPAQAHVGHDMQELAALGRQVRTALQGSANEPADG